MRVAIIALLSLSAAAGVAAACCPAFPEGADVKIGDQEVLIAYDAASGREHFVRRAAFKTDEAGFGFLVPTPTQPELAEAPNLVFDRLREAIEPRIKWINSYSVTPAVLCIPFLSNSKYTPAALLDRSGVVVLDEARVAGYDAAVLEASDADALIRWLGDNGYEARPALTDWVKPYVAAGWKVTAFKYAADVPGAAVSTKAVRLSFDTDRPLFPYRVPADQIAPEGRGNLLRLYYVGAARAQGALGEEGERWPAKTTSAGPLDDAPAMLGAAVPGVAAGVWLTTFEDRTWPSGTDDLYFTDSTDVEAVIPVVERTRSVDLFIPLDVILLVVGGIVLWRRRSKKGD